MSSQFQRQLWRAVIIGTSHEHSSAILQDDCSRFLNEYKQWKQKHLTKYWCNVSSMSYKDKLLLCDLTSHSPFFTSLPHHPQTPPPPLYHATPSGFSPPCFNPAEDTFTVSPFLFFNDFCVWRLCLLMWPYNIYKQYPQRIGYQMP